jgi:hypothetical protein
MHDPTILITGIVHAVYGGLRALVAPLPAPDRDRGAVSLEQVLWFVAVGVSVAVVAAIIWGKIRSEAERPVQAPSAP